MIKVKNVSKSYKNKKVLKNVSLNIEGIYGLIGPNGAGKTTLMRTLSGLISANEGEVLIEESDVMNSESLIKNIRDHIAYLPQDFTIYPKATIYECLNHIAMLKGMKDKKERMKRIDKVLHQVNLQDVQTQKIHKLSGGMRKRVGIAQMFLTEPSILIIDEPTAGLDIDERIRFRNLLRELSKDKTIIISSHIVEDVEFLCTKIGILKNGVVLQEGKPSEISQFSRRLVWEITIQSDDLAEVLKSHTVVDIKQKDYNHLDIRVLAKNKPANAKPLEPTLIDGCLSIINGWGMGEECNGAI
ncbi:ABC transporter ATP-binding protein [Priestia megaterium]|nr:ABC transporter ATP-binding protein [Priestia megaterium]